MQNPPLRRPAGAAAGPGAAAAAAYGGSRFPPERRRPPPPPSGFYSAPRAAAAAPAALRPASTLLLLRGGRIASRDLEALIAACPAAPDERHLSSAGSVAARLLFRHPHHALDAFIFIWRRRLDGAHLLLPQLNSAGPELHARLLNLFASRLRQLLLDNSCRSRISDLGLEISNITEQLRKQNTLPTFYALQERRSKVEEEKGALEARMAEFEAAVKCILIHIGERRDEAESQGEEPEVEPLWLGGVIDWGRVHSVMMRECRRLDDGLPIYAFRREILKAFHRNQIQREDAHELLREFSVGYWC